MAPSPDVIAAHYARLGRDAAAVFPLTFRSEVEVVGGPVAGTLNGFMYLRSLDDEAVLEVR
jgi:hypothetical protein